ncbi:LuxR C-terminal-related transcriptional regulator [Ornithinimicrobium cerasi]|uniref:LuxR C-terminal-related transcriptional regulator n=1 Tax=Ornithinimicrobium cerasi TaxID=2248773 RepID=UPI000BE2EC53|nr:LuxR family transcriptional regulator [Ornithinimicrobium cerasi]
MTITGLPGSGRTSLALGATRHLGQEDRFTVIEGRQASRPGALAAALHACGHAQDLFVDDVDHADGATSEIHDLHRVHPTLRLLLTSSKPLGLPGEVVVRLPPLPLPDLDADPAILVLHPAVRLFLDVSGRTGTAVEVEDSTITAVARVCHQLGGLPLAIRLVAARTATYSPATLATLLARAPSRMLRARAGTTDEHDLVQAVAWSVSLLTPAERDLLRDLAVFQGPVGVEVVDTVCERPELIDELSALVDVHLVDPRHDGLRSRFTIPPLVREHLAAAAGGGPSREVRDRHRRWALELATQGVQLESAGQLMTARQVVSPHEPDLMAALGDALAARDVVAATTLALALVPLCFSRGTTPEVCTLADDVLALVGEDGPGAAAPRPRPPGDRLVLSAWAELLRAETAGSLTQVESTVPFLDLLREEARQVDDRTLLRVTYVAVQVARSLVRRSIPEQWAEEGRELATRLHDPARLVRLETWTGMLAHQRGDVEEAEAWAWTALRRARGLDDPSLALAPAGLLHGLPRPPRRGDPGSDRDETLPTPAQLVNLARESGDLRALDWLEPTAAYADLGRGDLASACDHSAATLRRVRVSGARARAGAPVLCLFLVALQRGDVMWAGRLHGILGRYLDVLRPALPPAAAAAYDRAVLAYRASSAGHHDAASDVVWGAQLSWDAGIDATLGYAAQARASLPTARPGASSRPSPTRTAPEINGSRHGAGGGTALTPTATPPHRALVALTGRERDVMRLLVAGGTNREISRDLGITPKTVMHHTSSIYRKLGVRGRAEAVAWFLRLEPVPDDEGHPRLQLVEGGSGGH